MRCFKDTLDSNNILWHHYVIYQKKKNGDSLNFALPGNSFDYAMFMSFLELF